MVIYEIYYKRVKFLDKNFNMCVVSLGMKGVFSFGILVILYIY